MPTQVLKVLILISGALYILTHVAANRERSPKVLALDFTRHVSRKIPNSHRLRKRQNTVAADFADYEFAYLINVTIGTPPQSFRGMLATGTSKTWVLSRDSNICEQDPLYCETLGAFDNTTSSTFVPVGPQGQNAFNFSFQGGSTVEVGDYFNDTLMLGETVIFKMTMGLGIQSDTPFNILGVGYDSHDAIVQDDPSDIYPSFLAQLLSQGYINTLAYSLWRNDPLDKTNGSILFGGVDTDKFQGDLVVLPIQPSTNSSYTDFIVALSTVTFTDATGEIAMSQSNLALPVFIDSGSSLSYLPESVLNPIISGVGAINSDDNLTQIISLGVVNSHGGLIVPCSLNCSPTTFNFGFGGDGGPSIAVPMADLVLPLIDNTSSQPTFSDGEPICRFGIAPGGPESYTLGDTFLRSAYVVFDLANNQIAIAQADWNATSSNITEITGSAIPGASSTALGSAVLQTYLGNTQTNSPITETGTAQITNSVPSPTFRLGSCSSSTSQKSSSPSSKKSLAGAVGLPKVGSMTVVSGFVCLVSMVFGGSLVILM